MGEFARGIDMDEKIKKEQRDGRKKCLEDILSSTAKKKIIVSGAGTGKTYTFGELLKQNYKGNNLAMTFIRKLVEELNLKLSNYAEVKTFHAYCKKILHERKGRVELCPYLTKIIEEDSKILNRNLNNFDIKFRELKETSPEIEFYLNRGDYYKAVGFNDSVYRLLLILRKRPDIFSNFNQIVIDEFQDFNPLEVAFIDELEKKGNILIVGDDDQAIYDERSSSPEYIRGKYYSGQYDKFPLPFCTRCTKVIVDAVNEITINAEKLGSLKGRIPKKYECYWDDKEEDSLKYPHIIAVQISTAQVLAQYIQKEIMNIPEEEIILSNSSEKGYPTVLITGPKQYLEIIYKLISKQYSRVSYSPSEGTTYGPINAYELLIEDEQSNLGWRILVEYFDSEKLRDVITKSEEGTQIKELLNSDFIGIHQKIIECLKKVKEGISPSMEVLEHIQRILGSSSEEILNYFTPKEQKETERCLDTEPIIILTSYKGCKGLSAGYVFIVGMNNGDLPRDKVNISDVEICQFVVSLTRSRKCCYLLSTKWLIAPKDKKGEWIPKKEKSEFISWIPSHLIEYKGNIKAQDL
ncbi:MAG: ATP-dependent helicase [bacterium]|nr:ATP-dependent helicase [bacterium]